MTIIVNLATTDEPVDVCAEIRKLDQWIGDVSAEVNDDNPDAPMLRLSIDASPASWPAIREWLEARNSEWSATLHWPLIDILGKDFGLIIWPDGTYIRANWGVEFEPAVPRIFAGEVVWMSTVWVDMRQVKPADVKYAAELLRIEEAADGVSPPVTTPEDVRCVRLATQDGENILVAVSQWWI